ncbi:uncharacterized protein LOC113595847 isoform X3 [Acinonyx jubatus]|uniref:Uncharacterized protein LOC113595847 isoform X3 n=1 Tax=Acinonyx jubatus TaxID=32536 RepID=A0ABM3NW47_ACIJB|nr:uncharacterized protein LOC113595847 isoform X3 [Acinonyx jubatus]
MARVTRSAPGQKTFESEFCRESLSENTPQNCPVLSQTHDNTGTEVRTSPGVPGLWVIISAFQSILPDPMPQFSGAKMQNEVTVKLPLTHRGTLVSRNSFFKGVCSGGGEACSESLGLLEGGRRRGRWGGRLEPCHPSEAGDRKNLSILCAEPNMVLGLDRQRETEHAWGRNKGRGRRRIPSRPQAPSCQHRARHGARTHGPRDHDPSRSRRLTEPPGHPELENLSGLCGSHYIYIGEHQCLGECICEFWIKGEVNELSDTDASGTRPEEQRQEREQGAEAAVGPERAVLRSPPAPDSPRSTAPTSEPAWSRFDLRDPGLLRTDLELVNWVPPRHPLQIRGHAWVQNSPGSHRTSLSMQERKQAFLMIWKPGTWKTTKTLSCREQTDDHQRGGGWEIGKMGDGD